MSKDNDSTESEDGKVAYVAIDFGKNVNAYGVYGGQSLQVLCKPKHVRNDQSGFVEVCEQVQSLIASKTRVVIGFEPTGIYHEAWGYTFGQRFSEAQSGVRIRIVPPYSTKRARQMLSSRHHKSDFIDVPAIAKCLADEVGNTAYRPDRQAFELRQWAETYERCKLEQGRGERRLLTGLDRLWPGAFVDVRRFKKAHPKMAPPEPIVKTKALKRRLVRALLELEGGINPYEIERMSVKDLRAHIYKHAGRCGEKTAKRLISLAQSAVLRAPEICLILADHVDTGYRDYLADEARLTQLEGLAEPLIQNLPCAVLTSIPGLSAVLVARYYAHIGDVQRFACARQIWGFAGFDSIRGDSGDNIKNGPISKQGDSQLRYTLFQIGFLTSQRCPPIRHARQRALARGIGKVGATLHAAHKANRLMFSLMTSQQVFDPAKLR